MEILTDAKVRVVVGGLASIALLTLVVMDAVLDGYTLQPFTIILLAAFIWSFLGIDVLSRTTSSTKSRSSTQTQTRPNANDGGSNVTGRPRFPEWGGYGYRPPTSPNDQPPPRGDRDPSRTDRDSSDTTRERENGTNDRNSAPSDDTTPTDRTDATDTDTNTGTDATDRRGDGAGDDGDDGNGDGDGG